MPKQDTEIPTLASVPPEHLCEYVADLSRQLADIVRHRGLSTIVGLLELASAEAGRIAGTTANQSQGKKALSSS